MHEKSTDDFICGKKPKPQSCKDESAGLASPSGGPHPDAAGPGLAEGLANGPISMGEISGSRDH